VRIATPEEALGVSEKKSIDAVRLRSAPIEPSWIVAGTPRARCAELSRSPDGANLTLVWDCTAGDFDWIYTDDETVHILEGEAIVDDGSGKRTIGPGDVYLFPAGTTYRWRVPVYVKKLAFLHVPIPAPVFLAARVLRKLQTLGRGRRPSGFPTMSEEPSPLPETAEVEHELANEWLFGQAQARQAQARREGRGRRRRA
jgi:uncharacterized cupin superfamily protein